MTATTIRVQMAQRKDTAANWTAANPILLSGEIGYETNTKKFKIGDGTTNWNSLAYLPIPDGSGNLTITGNLEIGTTGSLTFEGSTANGFETTLAVTDPTADRTITLPNVSGTVVTTGDTGSVTSTMIADGTIVNADISGSAEIAVSKLANGTANQVIVTDGTNVSWSDNLTLAGDLTVNGTTTTINTQDLLVEDKNIIIGNVATPSDVTADGGGITLKGATDKTINWVDATDAWTSSERFSYPLGSATAPSLTFTGDPNTGIYSPGADQVAISSNSSERIRIGANGEIGLSGANYGTSGQVLTSAGSGAAPTWTTPSAGNTDKIEEGNSSAEVIDTGSDGRFVVTTEGSERLRVDSSGRLGLGTSSPSATLEVGAVSGAVTAGDLIVSTGSTTASVTVGRLSSTNADNTTFNVRNRVGTSIFYVDTPNSRVGIGTTTVDSRFVIRSHSGVSDTPILKIEHPSNDADFAISGLFDTDGNITYLGSNLYYNSSYAVARFDTGKPSSAIALSGRTGNGEITFLTGSGTASEKMRLDTSGRLLIGTSTSRNDFFNNTTTVAGGIQLELSASDNLNRFFSFTSNNSDTGGPSFLFGKSRGTSANSKTIVQSDDQLAALNFHGADGSDMVEAARISAHVDGTPGANDMPGRLVFSTTADGASSPTERMRITAKGNALFNTTSNTLGNSNPVSTVFNHVEGTGDHVVSIVASTASYASGALLVGCYRSANLAYSLGRFWSGDGSTIAFSDQEFNFRGDGNGFADGTWTGGGADYAEYFEWSDGNPDEEDRRGISVVLDGNQIRPAEAGEDPIGVISGNPSVVGDAAWNKWTGKYLRDDYGSYILDGDGNRQLNPAFDPDQEYINREQRPEWDCVGLMGKLRIRKGQPTGSRWIKMRDISDSVEEWLVR